MEVGKGLVTAIVVYSVEGHVTPLYGQSEFECVSASPSHRSSCLAQSMESLLLLSCA